MDLDSTEQERFRIASLLMELADSDPAVWNFLRGYDAFDED